MTLHCCGDPGDCICRLPGDEVRELLDDQADEGGEHQMPYCPGGCGPIGIEDVVGEYRAETRIKADACGFCGEFIEWRHV